MAEETGKKKKGCLFWGCLTLSVMCLFAIGVVVGGIFYVKAQINKVVADEPVPIPVYDATKEEAAIAGDKYAKLEDAIAKNKAETVSLTATDINTFIATAPEAAQFKGRLAVAIEGETLKVNGSIPISLIIPEIQNKYFNGDIDLKIVDANGQTQIYITDVKVKGESINERYLKALQQTEVLSALRQSTDPNARKWAAQFDGVVDNLAIRDDKLVVRTKGK